MPALFGLHQFLGTSSVLEQLGSTPDQVAASLKSHGITGVRNTVRLLNPIVRFVQTQVTDYRDIDVQTTGQLRVTLPDGRKTVSPLPQTVIDFLTAFNRGGYPELEMS